jgi:hypothetical protein
MATKKLPGRLIYAATVVAILGMTGGFVLASVLSVTTTNTSSTDNQVNGANSALIASGTPGSIAVAPGDVPAAVASCSSTAAIPSAGGNGGAVSAYISATTGSTTCTSGDWAMVYTITTGSTTPSGTYQVQLTTQWGTGPTLGENTVTLTLANTLTSAGTVTLYVDYGSPMAPTGGISTLQIVITP